MLANISKDTPVLLMDVGVGVVGFLLCFIGGKASGRDMDRDTTMFLVKMWGGIALLGMVLVFIM
ncbi:MAG: hypothetical protein WA414_05645 [Acidobacteriaceae bacterium]